MKRMRVWGMLLVMVMCTSIAMAQVDMTFTGVGNWTDPNLWDVGSVPGSVELANYVNISGPNTVCTVNTDTGDYAGGQKRMQVDGGAILVLEEGGVLAANTWSRIGVSGVGTLNQTGGLFEVQDDKLGIGDKVGGQGYYIMSGGTLTHADDRGDLGVGSREGTGTFTVIGTAPVIQMEELIVCERDGAAGTVEFVLDADGVSPIVLSNTATIDAKGDTTTSDLVIRATAVPPMADILLVDITSENAMVGAFDTVNGNPAIEGAQVVVSSGVVENTYTLTYMGGTGNDIVLLYQSSVTKTKIAWVSEWNADPNTGVPYDQGWIDMLIAEGYVVDANTAGNYTELTESKIAELESADMIIISRNTNSGGYATDVNEVTQWNSFEAPIIMMTGYIARSSRWEWIDSTATVEYAPETFMDVVAVDHPVFAGITTEAIDSLNIVDVIDETVDSGQNTFITAIDVGNGTLLARRMDDSSIWIAEWEAGVVCYEGSTQVPAGKRMLFTAGGGGGQMAGSMNLNADGQTMFLNAIKYMLTPAGPSTEGLVAYYAMEGDATDSSGNGFHGTIVGDPNFVDGAIGMAMDFNGDDYVDCGNDESFSVTEYLTVALWVNIRTIPTAWTGAITKGNTAWRISNNNVSTGMHFGFEDGSRGWQAANSATELNIGEWYHVCGVYDINVGAKIYINGLEDGSNPDTAGITQNTSIVAIGTNSDSTYPEQAWDGLLDEVMIFNRALSADEVAALAGM